MLFCECSALTALPFVLIPQSSLLPARAYLRVSQTQSADTCAERAYAIPWVEREQRGLLPAPFLLSSSVEADSDPGFSTEGERKHGLPEALRWWELTQGEGSWKAFLGPLNKYHKVGDLTPETYCLIILEAGSLRTMYGQGWLPLRSVRMGSAPCLSATFCDLLAVFRALWLMGASPPCPFHHAHMAFSCVHPNFPSYKNTSHVRLVPLPALI